MALQKMSPVKTSVKEEVNFRHIAQTISASAARADEVKGDNSNINPMVESFLSTLVNDYQLYPYAIESLKAQFRMHIKRNIIPEHDGKQLIEALEKVHKELDGNKITQSGFKSIYAIIENRISEIVPEAYLWFWVARSQTAQQVGDFKLWMRAAIDTVDTSIRLLQARLIEKAEDTVKAIYPANINSQLSQPSSFGHHLMAYVEVMGRGRSRFKDTRTRLNESPFSSGESVGTSFNVNRDMVSRILSFERASSNSVDALCNWDFVIDFISALASHSITISRLANELITWHSSQNGYISFSTQFVEQHNLLPCRHDQLALAALRAKASKSIGATTSIMSILKDLPMEPSRDYSEILDLTFTTFADVCEATNLMAAIIHDLMINRKAMKEAASKDFSTAQDLVEWIMQKTGVDLMEARKRTKKIIDMALEKHKKLSLLELDEIQSVESSADSDIYSVLIPSRALINRRSGNGSNPVQIRKVIRAARRKYL